MRHFIVLFIVLLGLLLNLIRKGDRVLAVQLAGLQPPKLETLRPLAQKALSRLP